MDNIIPISYLNDFIFCPISIYFHQLYQEADTMLYQETAQIDGTYAHTTIDVGRYSNKKNVLQGISVYCETYGIYGKIDIFDMNTGILTERKKRIKTIYDGYILQIYAQYFSLIEMGYEVKQLRLYSMDDNKMHDIMLPQDNPEMFYKFEHTIHELKNFIPEEFVQANIEKCRNCIYESACDRTLL